MPDKKMRAALVMINEEHVPPALKHIIRQFGLDAEGNLVVEWTRPMEVKSIQGEAGLDLIGLASIPVGRGMKVFVKPMDRSPTDAKNPLIKLV